MVFEHQVFQSFNVVGEFAGLHESVILDCPHNIRFVLLCKQKNRDSEKNSPCFSRSESRATPRVRQIDTLENQREFRRFNLRVMSTTMFVE